MVLLLQEKGFRYDDIDQQSADGYGNINGHLKTEKNYKPVVKLQYQNVRLPYLSDIHG